MKASQRRRNRRGVNERNEEKAENRSVILIDV
jgi:hypothetical protein